MTTLFAASLTPERVQEEVEYIKTIAGDDEAAHGAEDYLWSQVIEAIATNRLSGSDAQRAALYALQTRDVKFSRWRA